MMSANTPAFAPWQPAVAGVLARLRQQDVVRRLWRRDHTLWKPQPTEIADRLGWLDVPWAMETEVNGLEAFAGRLRGEQYRHVVLLGMGGSSLGPEVLHQTFGSAPGYPELIVLDSTLPDWVQAVTKAIEPARTLFLVSSKSGGTIEPLSLYKYFRRLVEEAVGQEGAGLHFAAVTDPGTSLVKLAQEQGFRQTFLNPPDIGGRYSVLSLFGLVPAVVQGMDVALLLQRAQGMADACGLETPLGENPGAWLGAAIAALALQGRDKLTLMASPGIAGFGLWAEQLIAESLGKEGKGIVPVAGEPLTEASYYGDDRLFVVLRLDGDDPDGIGTVLDKAIADLQAAGQPMLQLRLQDKYDLGAEFFRWEFATAIAGHLLGMHPFDQPNVQSAKDATDRVLARRRNTTFLPMVESPGSPQDLMKRAAPGDYLAILAYLRQTPEVDAALQELRARVMRRYHIATTLGYGPRYLHSTGQLHKGGPNTGLFLQITQAHPADTPIPGEDYTFGVLADAQALGDLHALQMSGRRVARVVLHQDYLERALQRLAQELG